jgi:hypothetical protein
MRIWACGVAVLAAGVAASTATATGGVRISGGSPAQQRVVRAVLVKLRSQRITGVTFKRYAHLLSISNGQKMDVSGTDRTVRTYWDEHLFAAAFLQESLTRGTPEPNFIFMNHYSFIQVNRPRRPGTKSRPGPRASAKEIAAYVSSDKAAASSAGAKVVGVDVMRPGPIGVALTLRVADPAHFVKYWASSVLAVVDNNQPTGIFTWYLGVRGPTGRLVLEADRFPSGLAIGVAPDLLAATLP